DRVVEVLADDVHVALDLGRGSLVQAVEKLLEVADAPEGGDQSEERVPLALAHRLLGGGAKLRRPLVERGAERLGRTAAAAATRQREHGGERDSGPGESSSDSMVHHWPALPVT